MDYSVQVKLWCDCPFWPDDGMCHLRDCSVCECTEDEIPQTFRKGGLSGSGKDGAQCLEDPKGVVDRTLDSAGFQAWTENDNPWTADDESSDGMAFTFSRPDILAFCFIG
jgi:ERO1-like protein alpha